MAASPLNAPTAQAFSIAQLMDLVKKGRVRIPSFQRKFRWDADDVLNLFDSIYRGYPIGSLLLWSTEVPHETVTIGSLRIEAEAGAGLMVVDGQQRITSLAEVLLSAGDVTDSPYSLFFDLDRKRFVRGRQPIPGHWVPMNRVIETRALLPWLRELERSGGVDEQVAAAEDLAQRIREYRLPGYIVETSDEAVLRTIFDRLNTFGKALTSAEVFQALHGGKRGESPEDLRTLIKQIASLGFGTIDDNSLLRAVLALRGSDVYRDFRTEFGEGKDPTDAFRSAAEAIERAISFLRAEARIPHVRVLPYRFVIPVLARFFSLHPHASARSRTLLRRWVWRDALTPGRRSTTVTAFRAAVRAIDGDEHQSVQRLLDLIGDQVAALEVRDSARLNEAAARASSALMSSWRPRSLVDGKRIDLATHFEDSSSGLTSIVPTAGWKTSLANRMIHPATTAPLWRLLVDSALKRSDPVTFREVLESHAISDASVQALEAGDYDAFLDARHQELMNKLKSTALILAEPGGSDRPPLAALLLGEED